jgi:putative heme-binding domain-containing protein
MPRVLTEKIPLAQIEAVLAAARVGGVCPIHRRDESSPIDLKLRDQLLENLLRLDWLKLPLEQQCGYVRTIEVILNRFGTPDKSKLDALVSKLDSAFPSKSFELNWLLCETLVFLQSPTIAEKAFLQMSKAPSQEEQIEYARSLRMLKTGWTKETRSAYLEWFFKAVNFHGGASFDKFIEFIRNDALLTLTDSEKIEFARLVDENPVRQASAQLAVAMFVGRKENAYQLNELVSMAEQRLLDGGDLTNGILKRDLDNGRRLFGAASCYSCHRFGNEGGANGPDLTSAARRYSIKDLLEQIMDPSKEINDQFVPVEVRTEEGEQYRGIVVNHSGDSLLLNTDAVDPNQRVTIDRKTITSIGPSKVSPMPTGLINMMTHEEILDLIAFILNGGTTSQSN